MSLQSVRQFLAQHAPDIEIIELDQSTATVDLAAKAHNVEPGQIAKTLSLKVKNDIILVVAKGDARLDNKKLKSTFGAKARMLSSDEVVSAATKPGTKHVNVACHEAACIKGAGSPARRYSRISAASSNPASELTPSLDITLNLCARMVLMFRSS